MTLQLSITARNGSLDGIETAIGPSPILKLFTGDPPADCQAGDTGTLLMVFYLPPDWAMPADGGVKAFVLTNGLVSSAIAPVTGTPGYFRLYDANGGCQMQGTVTPPGGGGDMTISESEISGARLVNITGWTITDPNG